eukprot:TRINITY_DN265_c0_g1_i3.p1 TRINITY_DN265_c0_g1~~TRINITY_DN265_c0_g1_i3.p1  ORF type:complete len:652 (+),score=105.39 TRINITY_DN265_c0_g1_i3:259-2214(+)
MAFENYGNALTKEAADNEAMLDLALAKYDLLLDLYEAQEDRSTTAGSETEYYDVDITLLSDVDCFMSSSVSEVEKQKSAVENLMNKVSYYGPVGQAKFFEKITEKRKGSGDDQVSNANVDKRNSEVISLLQVKADGLARHLGAANIRSNMLAESWESFGKINCSNSENNLLQDKVAEITNSRTDSAIIETDISIETDQVIEKQRLDKLIRKGLHLVELWHDKLKILEEKTGAAWNSDELARATNLYKDEMDGLLQSEIELDKVRSYTEQLCKAVSLWELQINQLDEALLECEKMGKVEVTKNRNVVDSLLQDDVCAVKGTRGASETLKLDALCKTCEDPEGSCGHSVAIVDQVDDANHSDDIDAQVRSETEYCKKTSVVADFSRFGKIIEKKSSEAARLSHGGTENRGASKAIESGMSGETCQASRVCSCSISESRQNMGEPRFVEVVQCRCDSADTVTDGLVKSKQLVRITSKKFKLKMLVRKGGYYLDLWEKRAELLQKEMGIDWHPALLACVKDLYNKIAVGDQHRGVDYCTEKLSALISMMEFAVGQIDEELCKKGSEKGSSAAARPVQDEAHEVASNHDIVDNLLQDEVCAFNGNRGICFGANKIETSSWSRNSTAANLLPDKVCAEQEKNDLGCSKASQDKSDDS